VSGHRSRLADALRAIAVTSPAAYAWFGRPSRALPPDVLAAAAPGSARASLVAALERELYRSFYTQGRPLPASPERTAARPDAAFTRALWEANAGAGGWQPGWRLDAWDGRHGTASRDGLAVRIGVQDCRAEDGPLVRGAGVEVRRPKALLGLSPGFHTILGDRQPDAGAEIRVYFHVTAAGAEPLVAACTNTLNGAAVPFVLKVVDRPGGFTRCDAAVLYLEPAGFDRARAALAEVVAACAPHLHDETPAFTTRLAPGVGAGEHDPATGASFGALRCSAAAEGVVSAHEEDALSLEDRLEVVARRFAVHGLDVDRPYLARGIHVL
jgi:hypothetical protein